MFRADGLGVHDRTLLRRKRARSGQRRRRAGMADPSVPGRRGGGYRRLLDLSHAPGGDGRSAHPKHRSDARRRSSITATTPASGIAIGSPTRARSVKEMLATRDVPVARRGMAIDDLDKPIAEALTEAHGPRPSPGGIGQDGSGRRPDARSSDLICASTASTICASPTPASIPTTSCTTPI